MSPSDLQPWLTDLPVIGPLFAGSIVAVILRLLGVVVAVVVGVRLLRWAWGRGGGESERALLNAGRLEEVGDLCSRKGELDRALDYYTEAQVWLKAGHAARRLGRSEQAAKLFERAGEIKLAVAAFEAADLEEDVVRLAVHSTAPSLLSKAAAWYDDHDDHLSAGKLYARAGRLRDAEQAFAKADAEGLEHAIQMYVDAFRERHTGGQSSKPALDLAFRGARLMLRAGQRDRALKLCHRAGIPPEKLEGQRDSGPRSSTSSSPGLSHPASGRQTPAGLSRPSSSGRNTPSGLSSPASGRHTPTGLSSPASGRHTPAGLSHPGSGQPSAARASRDDLAIDSSATSAGFVDRSSAPSGARRSADSSPRPPPEEVSDDAITIPDRTPLPKAAAERKQKQGLTERQRMELAATLQGVEQQPEAPPPGRPKTEDVAEALLAVLESDDPQALAELPPEILAEVSDNAATIDFELGRSSRTVTKPEAKVAKPAAKAAPSREESSFGFSSDVTSRYELQGPIGAGGMGDVYKAKDRSLGREVALKFLSAKMVGDEMMMHFFLREARAAAALNHPAIVTVYDIGVLDGRPFICMEFVEGTDLSTRLEQQGPIELSHAVKLASQLAQALDYAHERNVVHRDIKPPNVIQARGGVVKILDFGLAKAMKGGSQKSTMVAGTPDYMSPEQLAGREVDGRTDIFSLGVLFYEVLTASLPFEGALRSSNFEPPSARAPWLPSAVDLVVRVALALDPEDRYQRGNELSEALQKIPSGA